MSNNIMFAGELCPPKLFSINIKMSWLVRYPTSGSILPIIKTDAGKKPKQIHDKRISFKISYLGKNIS